MRDSSKIVLAVVGWTVTVSVLHLSLNIDWASVRNEYLPRSERKLNVAYIPVT